MPRAGELKLPTSSVKKQLASKQAWNSTRSVRSADFFTFGYSGRTLSEILEAIRSCNVVTVVDIRTNPVSMYRPEFSKNNLKKALEETGINYLHAPELGVPRDIRAKAIASGSRDVIWDWYDEHVASLYAGTNLHRFFNLFEHPSAYMCSELDPVECHRHRLSLILERAGLSSFDL